MDLGKLMKGSVWIFIGGNLTTIFGYLFWIIASKIVPPNIIGFCSAIITLQSVSITIFSLGLPTGVKFYIGQSKGEANYKSIASYFSTTLLILIIANLPLGVFFLYYSFYPFISLLNHEVSFYLAILILLGFLNPLLYSFFNSILKTKIVALANVISTIAKLSMGIIFLFYNPNNLGILFGFIIGFLTEGLVLIIATYKIFNNLNIRLSFDLKLCKKLLKTSFPAWLPNILVVSGQSLGVIVVYNIVGSFETGLYYLALSIAQLIYALPNSIQMLIFPVLSGMKKGQEKFISKVINIALVLAVPSALIVGLYAEIPFILLGFQYLDAAPLLTIIVLGAIIYPIYAGYYSYLYALERYKHVTILGFILNGSRIFLYFVLGLIFSEIGVALSYSLGIVLGFLTMIVSAKIIGFKINWRDYLKIILIPAIIAIILFSFNISWIIGIPSLVVISLLAYSRTGILKKEDLHEIFIEFISEEKLIKIYSRIQFLSKIFFGN